MDGGIVSASLAAKLAQAGVITHLLRLEAGCADEALEGRALSALCDNVAGHVFRIADCEYGFQAGPDDDPDILEAEIAARLFSDPSEGIVRIEPCTAPDPPAMGFDRMPLLLIERMGEAAARAAGTEAHSVLDAAFAVGAASLASDEIGRIVDRMAERVQAIIPQPSALPDPTASVGFPALVEEMRAIAGRLSDQEAGIASLAGLVSGLAEKADGPAAEPAALEARIDDLAGEVAAALAGTARIAERIEALAASGDALLSGVAALDRRLDATDAAAATAPMAEAFGRIEAGLSGLAERLAALETPPADAPISAAAAEIVARLDGLETRLTEAPATPALDEAALMRRLAPVLDQLDLLVCRNAAQPDLAAFEERVGALLQADRPGAAHDPEALAEIRAAIDGIREATDRDEAAEARMEGRLAGLQSALERLDAADRAVAGRLDALSVKLDAEASARRSVPVPVSEERDLARVSVALQSVLRRFSGQADALQTSVDDIARRAADGARAELMPPCDCGVVLALDADSDHGKALDLARVADPPVDRILAAIEAVQAAIGSEPPSGDAAGTGTRLDSLLVAVSGLASQGDAQAEATRALQAGVARLGDEIGTLREHFGPAKEAACGADLTDPPASRAAFDLLSDVMAEHLARTQNLCGVSAAMRSLGAAEPDDTAGDDDFTCAHDGAGGAAA